METKIQKRIPYSNTNFESIRTENYVYIDKTQYVELIERENNDNLFLTRPRKFGKSLFFSMLSNYYDINQADKFDQLFGDLYIGKHPTPKHNTYMVLNLDFSGLDTTSEKSFATSLSGKIQDNVRNFLGRYEHLFPKGDIYSEEIKIEQLIVIASPFIVIASVAKQSVTNNVLIVRNYFVVTLLLMTALVLAL